MKFLILQSIFAFTILFTAFGQEMNPQEKGTRTIYLIRHGEYNQADTSDEDIGRHLTPLGIAQARLLSARLKSTGINFTSLISSTMTRAKETAEVINEEFPELELKQSDLIRECTPPSRRQDIIAGVNTTEKELCVKNIEEAFTQYFIPSPDEKDRNDLIVCHGNVIRYFVTKVLRIDTMAWLQMSIANCSLTIIRVLPDASKKLDAFSDTGHIPLNMQTYTGGENEVKELKINSDEWDEEP